MFMLTESKPDRENNHQSRCGPLPLWKAIVDRFQAAAGEPQRVLTPVTRQKAKNRRRAQNCISGLVKEAAETGRVVEGRLDLYPIVDKFVEDLFLRDDDLSSRWEEESRRCGALDELTDFSFPADAAA